MRAWVWVVLALAVLVAFAFMPFGSGDDRNNILKRARAVKKRYAKERAETEKVESNE